MKKILKFIFEFILIFICIILFFYMLALNIKEINSKEFVNEIANIKEKAEENNIENLVKDKNSMVILNENYIVQTKYKLNDWRLVLVNSENKLPEDFSIKLSNIDSQRQFDSRAIEELNEMLNAAKKVKIGNLWVQSAYRSTEKQEELFNNKVDEYLSYGLSKEEAEKRTSQFINKANSSEHNIGLAVDFNYVEKNFEQTKAFEWLEENAENYGFILRYKKEKEEITKVKYEPWHWRYVGVEHAKKMNELNMCLEEYVDFLENM